MLVICISNLVLNLIGGESVDRVPFGMAVVMRHASFWLRGRGDPSVLMAGLLYPTL